MFSAAEVTALETWVRAGGGIITLMGYGGQTAEVNPTNQLVAFTGMSYKTDDTSITCADNCCYCAGSSVPTLGWNAAHPISANITTVGSFHGRSITTPADAQIVAQGEPWFMARRSRSIVAASSCSTTSG